MTQQLHLIDETKSVYLFRWFMLCLLNKSSSVSDCRV